MSHVMSNEFYIFQTLTLKTWLKVIIQTLALGVIKLYLELQAHLLLKCAENLERQRIKNKFLKACRIIQYKFEVYNRKKHFPANLIKRRPRFVKPCFNCPLTLGQVLILKCYLNQSGSSREDIAKWLKIHLMGTLSIFPCGGFREAVRLDLK